MYKPKNSVDSWLLKVSGFDVFKAGIQNWFQLFACRIQPRVPLPQGARGARRDTRQKRGSGVDAVSRRHRRGRGWRLSVNIFTSRTRKSSIRSQLLSGFKADSRPKTYVLLLLLLLRGFVFLPVSER